MICLDGLRLETSVGHSISINRDLKPETAARQTTPAHLVGCPVHDLKSRLRDVGLRPTRQRVALGWLLFGRGDRHLTAEILHEEAQRARVPVSLATVYNTLNQFSSLGLLREIAVDGNRTYFDTNTSDHHHFFIEGNDGLMDIPHEDVTVSNLPMPPEGFEVSRVEVVVRLRKKHGR